MVSTNNQPALSSLWFFKHSSSHRAAAVSYLSPFTFSLFSSRVFCLSINIWCLRLPIQSSHTWGHLIFSGKKQSPTFCKKWMKRCNLGALTMFGSFPSPKSLNLSESKSFQSPSCCRSAIECLEKSILIFPSTSSSPSSSFSSSTSTQAPPPPVLEKCNKMSGKSLSYIIIQQMGGPRIPLEEMILLFFLLHWGETCSWDLNRFFREKNVVEETKQKFDEFFLQILQILVNHLTLNKLENNPF